MVLSAGTQLGPYEIVSPLGAGGMGEVYRARDTRLKRQVALKILPAALAMDPERLARFQREAEVLASLNHPHIAAIYGLEDAGGMKALVMELVEGPTLGDRIGEGPLPIDEALPIAAQIAEALEAAHDQGIIHRDLKPANIKVREDSTVKVLDFGLAKLTETDAAGRSGSSDTPTMTSPAQMTGMGTILGTAAYMSPEQARGRAVNKRTDIWAFGAVLYEMLTGRRAFEGEGIADTIAAVMKTTPDWSALPREVPPPVVTLIQQCLEKDRNARIGDIAVARFLLSTRGAHTHTSSPGTAATATDAAHGAGGTGGASTGRSTGGGAQAAAWAVEQVFGPAAGAHVRSMNLPLAHALPAVLAGILVGALVMWLVARRPIAAPLVTHLQMSVQPADQLVNSIASPRPSRTAFAISPDGRLVVFSAVKNGAAQLYLRRLDRLDATPLAGTEGGNGPFFSPDGAWIAFWTNDKLEKVPVAGGPATAICDVPAGYGLGASWDVDGTIFFANEAGISKVSSDGGTPAVIVSNSRSHDSVKNSVKNARALLPHPLPGSKAILTTVEPSDNWDAAEIVLQPLGPPLSSAEHRVLIQGGADAHYVDTGHLVYMKSGTLMAVPFNLQSQQVTGAPVALIDGVAQGVNAANNGDDTGAGQFAISATGTLVYVPGGPFAALQDSYAWVDRAGGAQPIAVIPAASYFDPRLSPDGRRMAVTVRRAPSRETDVWVYDIARGAPTRLTFGGGASPVWSPDGKRIAFVGSGTEGTGIYVTNADGSGKPEHLSEGWGRPSSWSGAANAIAFLRDASGSGHGLWVLPLEGDRKPQLFLESRFELYFPTFSPDGHWMAYTSNESGAFELYVQPYPGPGEKIRVSTAGAFDPIWPANGHELLYHAFEGAVFKVYTAPIPSLAPFRVDAPRVLFEAKPGVYDTTLPERSWDISPDSQRFLMARFAGSADKPVTSLDVVLNWTEDLKRLVPQK